MTRNGLLARLAGLRQARAGQIRVPHKPLLLLWLFGQFAVTGSGVASYQQAEEPVSQLINDFGPPGSGPPCRSFTWNASCGSCGTCRKGNRPGCARTPRLAAGARSGRPSAGSRGTAPGRSGNSGGGRPAAPGPAFHASPGRPDLRCGRP
jgi:hypothetical protein